jgi:tetratricopeptide (TPR) repeat protein
MNLMKLFNKKNTSTESKDITDPSALPEPKDVDSAMRRGWAYHSRKQHAAAESDFRQALEYDPHSVDAHYALGLILKAQGRNDEAVSNFKQVLELITTGVISNQSRAEMLRRLSMGHVNELIQGDWNLEEEVWHHKS